jgi:O-antigen ligase
MAGALKWKGLISGKGFLTFILLVIFIFSVMYLITDTTDRLYVFSKEGITEASLKTRMDIWGGTLGIIAESPLIGKGIGTFKWAFLPFRPEGFLNTANFAHNDYLQTAAEMGIPAVLIFLWLIFIPIKRAFRGKMLSPELAGCAAGIMSLAFHGLIDFNFHVPANTIVCVLYAGFIMGGQFFSGEVRHV